MAQNLNEVQVKFVNETVRPMIEDLIAMRYRLEAFVLDFDNQQTPIVSDAQVLNDGAGGVTNRSDAPTLTGTNITQLRTFANNMLGQLSGASLNALIALAVRDVNTIVKS